MDTRTLLIIFLCLVVFLPQVACAQGPERFVGGVVRTVAAPFEVPKGIIEGFGKSVFPIGIIGGALSGTFKAVTEVFGGVKDMVQGAAPAAKLALPFLI